MESIVLGFIFLGVVLIGWWARQNDDVPEDQPMTGLFAMKHSVTPDEADAEASAREGSSRRPGRRFGPGTGKSGRRPGARPGPSSRYPRR